MSIDRILDEISKYDAVYDGALTSHLPMALQAMHHLGANINQLNVFAEKYVGRLSEKRRYMYPIDRNNITSSFGNYDLMFSYENLFTDELHSLGVSQLLRKYIPLLQSGVAASGFHGLIRTAYGFESNSAAEIVQGLSLWAATYLPFNNIVFTNDRDICDAVRMLDKFGRRSRNIITAVDLASSMRQMVNVPSFYKLSSSINPCKIDIAAFAALSVHWHLQKETFVSLHMVTATHALRVLKEFFNLDSGGLSSFWCALCAAIVKTGQSDMPLSGTSVEHKMRDWPIIKQLAVDSMDDHIIKLVYSCYKESIYYNDPSYKEVATRAVKNVM